MFGLPAATVAIIFGIPAIWAAYTLIFVYLSRGWRAEDVAEDRAAGRGRDTSAGPGPTTGGGGAE